ncbi:MAG: 23S rRNA (adenine(2503)-C(2))-methyltransferase RlmN [Cyanosarcina radialis HA8281-LM2]|jgi:23S rRNA (adenine2503-C2)-methyltransferase|nr:23S rRNA (adenine(2503)-C(2))-methyltransferase RlmN [Cyanosarcina radialis HA8281-LM2]
MSVISTTTLPEVDSTPPLLGSNLAQLTAWVQQQGQASYRGKQLYEWIYEKGARSLDEITVFPKKWRENIQDIPIGRSTIHHRSVAPDGTVKYLLRLADGQTIETVGIPSFKRGREGKNSLTQHSTLNTQHSPKERLTVCVSSQVGCPMACDFCATGKDGFIRNLAPHEIIDQVLTVQADFQRRVSHIVFMGMGEPLLNTENVVQAIACINQDIGIGQRSITLSTVGIPRQILKLAEHQWQITLAVSLHAPNQALREKLIPTAHRYPLEKLLADCRQYVEITGRRLSFEYILLAGVNDLPEHAEQLAKHLRGFQSHVNLIPYNPIAEADYQRPSRDRVQAFADALKQRHIAVSVRYSRGLSADAACGQLRTKNSGVQEFRSSEG